MDSLVNNDGLSGSTNINHGVNTAIRIKESCVGDELLVYCERVQHEILQKREGAFRTKNMHKMTVNIKQENKW